MTPLPWFIAKRRPTDTSPAYGRVRANRFERDGLQNLVDRHIDPDQPITLRPREWLCIHNKSRTVAWVHRSEDALIVIGASKLYVALLACHDAIRYPRGTTEGEWIILRRRVADAVCTVAPLLGDTQGDRE